MPGTSPACFRSVAWRKTASAVSCWAREASTSAEAASACEYALADTRMTTSRAFFTSKFAASVLCVSARTPFRA